MFRLFTLLPWPVMALLSALLFWMAQDGYKEELLREAEKAEALQMDAPAPVAIDEFITADVHLADEVHVTAWINTDHNYELTKQRKGTDTVRRMFVLFGPGDTPDTKVARGVIVLHPGDVDAFLGQILPTADVTDPRLIFSLLGQRVASPDLSDMVDDAFAERGLTKDADFLAIDPYLEGRAAALAPDPDAPRRVATIFGVLGAIAALMALGKVLGKVRARRQAGAEPTLSDEEIAPPPVAAPRPQPKAAQPGQGYGTLPTPAAANAWSPLAAVMAKQAALDPSAMPKGYVAPSARIETVVSGASAAPPRKGFAMVTKLGLGVALYAGLFLSFGTGTGPLSTTTMQQMIPSMTSALAQTGWLPSGFGATPDPAPLSPEAVPASLPDASLSGPQGLAARTADDRAGIVVKVDRPVPLPAAAPVPTAAPVQAIPALVTEPDAPGPADRMMDGLRGMLFQGSIALSAFLLTMALGLGLARRNRKPAAQPSRDPWDRLSERLR